MLLSNRKDTENTGSPTLICSVRQRPTAWTGSRQSGAGPCSLCFYLHLTSCSHRETKQALLLKPDGNTGSIVCRCLVSRCRTNNGDMQNMKRGFKMQQYIKFRSSSEKPPEHEVCLNISGPCPLKENAEATSTQAESGLFFQINTGPQKQTNR